MGCLGPSDLWGSVNSCPIILAGPPSPSQLHTETPKCMSTVRKASTYPYTVPPKPKSSHGIPETQGDTFQGHTHPLSYHRHLGRYDTAERALMSYLWINKREAKELP